MRTLTFTTKFCKVEFNVTTEPIIISDQLVPANYVNVSQLCTSASKRMSNWTRLKRTQAYLRAIADNSEPIISILTCRKKGLGGVWAPLNVALQIADWVHVEVGIWASRALYL